MEEEVGPVKTLLRIHKLDYPVALSDAEIKLLQETPQEELLAGLTEREVRRLTKLRKRAGLAPEP